MNENDADALFKILYEDALHCYRLAFVSDKQFYRRAFIRAMFAFIEGTVWTTKQSTLEIAETLEDETGVCDPQEIAFLQDKSYRLLDGEKKLVPAHISLTENIKSTFKTTAKLFGSDFVLDTSAAGWQAFIAAIKIRDRLMHPKTADKMEVTQEELGTARDAMFWYVSSQAGLNGITVEALQGQQENLQQQLNNTITEVALSDVRIAELEARIAELDSQAAALSEE